jgi:ATP-dependent Zn protease
MVAEELFLGETTSGVAGDLQAATTAAAQMVGTLGMAGTLFSYSAVRRVELDLTGKVSATQDGLARIEAILETAMDEVRTMLRVHSHVVEGLRDALLAREELIGEEILDVIRAVRPKPATP